MKAYIYLFTIMIIFPLVASDYLETKKMNISASGIEVLEIECGAGFLKIRGVEGIEDIQVTAEIEIEGVNDEDAKQIIEKRLVLGLDKTGDKAVLISKFEGNRSFFSFISNGDNVLVNLSIEIPMGIDVDIDDGSGLIEISDIRGKIKLNDGSGAIDITNTIGNINLDDGSGAIEIRNIKGEIEIDDGSGDIQIEDASGLIDIVDGSGSINIRKVSGDISVRDGSGSITIVDVDGDVRIYDGSGSIDIDRVEKDVIIEEAGSGGVSISQVNGRVKRYDK